MKLRNASDSYIIEYAFGLGYTFTAEDCDELRKNPFPFLATDTDETVAEAVDDFLNAYER